MVPCEVQIRTLLQDSWAELAHDDIFKPAADLPPDLKARMRDLGQMLSTADEIASDIRARVAEEVSPSDAAVDLTKISSDGAARIFAEVFGKNPPEYVVKAFLNACEEAGISSLTEARDLLNDTEFRDKISSEYQRILGVPISAEEIFILIPAAVHNGPERAISETRKLARKEKQDAEKFWRREVLRQMPETLDGFKEELIADTLSVGEIAEALGAVGECAICGEQLINADSFEHAVVDYYDEDEVDGTIEAEVVNSGFPITDEEFPNLCTYHAHQISKDD